MVTIERGIKKPSKVQTAFRRYPFDTMQVDESFRVEAPERHRVATAASLYGLRHGKRFSVCKDGGAFRCWRVA